MRNRMRHLRHILLFVIFAIFLLVSILTLRSKGNPDLAFPNGTYHDFGTINEGELVNYEFIFKNNGNSNLRITEIKTGCGCTSAKITEKVLSPGKEGKVLVSYKGRPTPKRETLPVWLITNDPKKPIAELMLTGNVQKKVFWYPKTVSFFADNKNAVQTKTVKFLTDKTGGLELSKLSTSSKYIKTTCDTDDGNIICKIDLVQECPRGNSSEKIMCEFLVGDEHVNIEIPIYLMIH